MFMHKLYNDNNITIEFTYSTIFVKDALTQRVLVKGKINDSSYFLGGTLLQHPQASPSDLTYGTHSSFHGCSTNSLFVSSIKPHVWHSHFASFC